MTKIVTMNGTRNKNVTRGTKKFCKRGGMRHLGFCLVLHVVCSSLRSFIEFRLGVHIRSRFLSSAVRYNLAGTIKKENFVHTSRFSFCRKGAGNVMTYIVQKVQVNCMVTWTFCKGLL